MKMLIKANGQLKTCIAADMLLHETNEVNIKPLKPGPKPLETLNI